MLLPLEDDELCTIVRNRDTFLQSTWDDLSSMAGVIWTSMESIGFWLKLQILQSGILKTFILT